MSWFAGITQILLVLALLAAAHVPLGNYMARVFLSETDTRAESVLYRLTGVDSSSQQRWRTYFLSVLGFTAVSLVVLFGLLRLQHVLPLSNGKSDVPVDQAINTAVSFVTNTNWQSYSGETTMGFLAQMAGLAVQNFVSAAVGIAVAVALIRGLMRSNSLFIGNFWVDLTRSTLRILLPLSVLFAIIYMGLGVIDNLTPDQVVHTVTGGTHAADAAQAGSTITQTIPGGPDASQEVIKHLGTNGGGFFNANSAHPLSAPSALVNLANIFLILLIPSALPRTFGIMVGSRKQGWAILVAMATFFVLSLAAVIALETTTTTPASHAAGAAMEGRETRFGVIPSAFFAVATTLTSTGAIDSAHSSYSGLGGAVLMINMMIGEIAPGGVGSGLYGMLIVAIVAVFVCGLMVGRTPEFLGKRIGRTEITLASTFILVSPALTLIGTAVATLCPGTLDSVLNTTSAIQSSGHATAQTAQTATQLNPHALSEILYAFTSAANNNGSAFAGLDANTPFFNIALAIAMLLGRLVPIGAVLALAGALAKQTPAEASPGTLPTHRPLFVGVVVGSGFVISALTFLPVLALGPINEGLM
ncbi:potassium-transporting ATPase potassium-binding subunit [Brevibacterium sediminis]|uniref:Potassium-transporting ATPase potassium-binding subunit n=1 Tax=Brevibacterium sediminis TaxID=1857024 RepID=A0ABQ1N1X2_9MICO|nr:potassium-transporting ATPase subunit KdpA [Brevibacterium sediminis]GGC50720.1 potassium-transporting ATPase potassium-binding subunit [Brevibacterium sediminis]